MMSVQDAAPVYGLSAQERSEARVGINRLPVLLVGTALLAALVLAALALSAAVEWRGRPFIGALLTPALEVDGTQPVTSRWAALDAGLERGDRIIAINGGPVRDSADLQQFLSSRAVGEQIELQAARTSGGVRALTIQLGTMPTADFVALFGAPFATGVIVLALGGAVFLLRSEQATGRWVALAFAGLSIVLTTFFDLSTTHRYGGAWMLSTGVVGGALAALAQIFPLRTKLSARRPYAPVILCGGFVFSGAVLALLYRRADEAVIGLAMPWLGLLVLFIGYAILLAALVRGRQRVVTPVVRDQANTMVIGMALALAVGVGWLLNVVARSALGWETVTINAALGMPLLLAPVLGMAFAVAQRRSFDTDRAVSRALTYTLLLLALIVGYFLLVFSASLLTRGVVGASDPILIAIVVFFIAVLFVPVRERLQERIDRAYFRKRINYQSRVEAFGQQLSSLVGFEDAIRQFRTELEETLQPEALFVYLPDPSGEYYAALDAHGISETDVRFSVHSPLIEVLRNGEGLIYLEEGQPWPPELVAERARLNVLDALVITALRGAGGLSGFVILSAPRSGSRRYSVEELRFVSSLTSQISVAVERAQAMNALERRVRELDVLSQVSQAANFTVAFDDLLELISTQVGRLVDAPYFTITLRDERTDELWHAFFLEDDERYREREGRRWPMGRDLFSDVVRSRQGMRVDDYSRALAERGIEIRGERAVGEIDPRVRAWMAVPLAVGAQVFGVMTAGTAQAGRVFTDDQYKIFSDIAALAATSLDKARLFAETNARARQLAALNDISRQLVASGVNLEALLELITERATELVDGEAGALLLTAEDSPDLEFRVVTGGGRQRLVGLRVPMGRGLVGQVAASGAAAFVNDIGRDTRYLLDLGDDDFQPRAILAAPLIAQGRVIGALEVLNKRGGPFTQDDADLLTTLTGQAAVAIENARLFRMTDLQLSQRLSELETLERIDVELNRSLDLRKVARITVDWAMENSSATAGALGLVIGDPPRLEIVYSEGYEPEDAPEGAEGRLWPLDRGILARVLRTRQPDLVPDVSIDPEYVPILRGGKSQITLPMLSGNVVIALLILETNREPRLRIADMPFLQRLAEHASIAIANAQLYAELERANQSKSEFVSFVAHELKNPLTSIKGYSEFLLGGQVGGLSEMQKNFVTTIRSNAERMNTLVSDLNDVTKLQTNNMRMNFAPVDFQDVVEETIRPLQKLIGDKEQSLVINAPDDLPAVYADSNRLIQVLTNLISNANKYSPVGASITISAFVDRGLRDAKGNTLEPMLHVQVKDSGIGMSTEDLARLFTPYFRSENPLAREQPGTGLGLTITRGIIEQHGGHIWVESVLERGTTFHFTVPLAK